MMHAVWKNAALASLIAFGAFPTLAAHAQPPGESSSSPEISSSNPEKVPEALLDVIVTGADGKPVLGLEADDFVLKVGGKPVPVQDVTFSSVRRLMKNTGLNTDEIPEERYFILLFEKDFLVVTSTTRLWEQRKRVLEVAKKWLRLLEPNDWVAVATYDQSLELLQDFTRDPDILMSALDRTLVAKGGEPSPGPSPNSPTLAALPKGKELVSRTSSIHEALEEIARATRGIGARKNLLLLTDGISEGSGGSRQVSMGLPYLDALRELNAANVAIYPMDIWERGSPQRALLEFAEDTGGKVTPRVGTSFESVLTDSAAYYLLHYPPPQAGRTSKKVQVTTTRPGLVVRTRTGVAQGKD
jgi:VWFA-related protein